MTITFTCETYIELLTHAGCHLFDICQVGAYDLVMPKPLPMVDISAPICCAPVSAAPLDDDTALEIALRLKALADPVRIKLVSILLADTGDGICTCDLAAAVGLTEATTSHHLGQLRKAGMVAPDRRGMNVYYRARPESLEALRSVLGATTGCC